MSFALLSPSYELLIRTTANYELSRFATTPSAKGEKLRPSDVVLWVPHEYSKEVGDQMSDTRPGWVGLIRAKIKPEINPANPSFVVGCRYD
jgi:hypothetical protein